jgi:hypothetical protein
MKKEKLNESAEAGAMFISLHPDDYHGAPEVDTVFPSSIPGGFSGDVFPTIPSREEVFNDWLAAGYNAFDTGWDGDFDNPHEVEEGQKETFELYGDMPLYYATYMIVMNDELNPQEIIENINYDIQEESYNGNNLDPDDFVKLLNGIQGIIAAYVLTR